MLLVGRLCTNQSELSSVLSGSATSYWHVSGETKSWNTLTLTFLCRINLKIPGFQQLEMIRYFSKTNCMRPEVDLWVTPDPLIGVNAAILVQEASRSSRSKNLEDVSTLRLLQSWVSSSESLAYATAVSEKASLEHLQQRSQPGDTMNQGDPTGVISAQS